MSIVVGNKVYLKRAKRTGKLDGWSTRIEGEGEGEGENMKAIVEIHRKDWRNPSSTRPTGGRPRNSPDTADAFRLQ
jgi:hypothetical protein